MTIVAIILFLVEFNSTGSIARARTFVFLTIVFFELFQAVAARSTIFSSITVGLFKNRAFNRCNPHLLYRFRRCGIYSRNEYAFRYDALKAGGIPNRAGS